MTIFAEFTVVCGISQSGSPGNPDRSAWLLWAKTMAAGNIKYVSVSCICGADKNFLVADPASWLHRHKRIICLPEPDTGLRPYCVVSWWQDLNRCQLEVQEMCLVLVTNRKRNIQLMQNWVFSKVPGPYWSSAAASFLFLPELPVINGLQ